MKKPETNRKKQAEHTKKRLLEEALKLFSKNGYDNVKIIDICNEVGVSVGAFYHHFKNKSDILVEAYLYCDDYFSTEIYPELKDRSDSDVILDYLDYQMQYAINYGVDIVSQIYKAQLFDITDFFLSLNRGLPSGLISIIQHLQSENIITSNTKAYDIGKELLIISRGIIYNWCQCNGNYDLKKINREITSKYLHYYLI